MVMVANDVISVGVSELTQLILQNKGDVGRIRSHLALIPILLVGVMSKTSWR